MSGEDWIAANQRVLVAEFARLRARLAGKEGADSAAATARTAMQPAAAIDMISTAFELSDFERDILLLCAGIEMDPPLAAACALHGETSHSPFATFNLALSRFAGPHWSALAPVRPLRGWRLLEVRDERTLASSRLCIDERILHFLAGINFLDPRLQPLLRAEDSGASSAAAPHPAVAHAVERLAGRAPAVLQLVGDDTASQVGLARQIATSLGRSLYTLRAADFHATGHEAQAFATLWQRESILLSSALLVRVEDANASLVARLIERLTGLVIVAARTTIPLSHSDGCIRVELPDAAERKRLWQNALGSQGAKLNGGLDAVAAQFRLSSSDIEGVARETLARMSDPQSLERSLWKACRESARSGLDGLAQRVEPAATWPDLVLPAPQIATLHQVATQVRQRIKVYEEWGFGGGSGRGAGITVLFSGESGTGKTMAAEVLANELHLDLYRVDLANTVSKYIGETEKNLGRIFDAAEDSGAILLFDEADALFGKRSEVTDSHDRYANIEVSYLLQRMEQYRGLAILTTNLKAALDPAFQRRLRFVVQFPFPDETQRELIWRSVFPHPVPREAIEYAKLARLNVAGGSIRNIALNAAFLAAEAGKPINMNHLLQRSEERRVGKECRSRWSPYH